MFVYRNGNPKNQKGEQEPRIERYVDFSKIVTNCTRCVSVHVRVCLGMYVCVCVCVCVCMRVSE